MTRPANRPEGRGPARGYSWPPFERGNQVALRHGAHDARVYEPLAAELVGALLDARPDLAPYPEAVAAWARAEARCALLSQWVADRGLIGQDGEPIPGLRWLVTFERQAAEFRATLGLDPTSEARLTKERADATRGAVDLERLRERGRAARMVAENARRDALEAPGKPQDAAEGPEAGGTRGRRCVTADALDLLHGLVLEDGRRWGEVAEPFQLGDAAAVLDRASATPIHFLTRPRGASKTTDLAGIAVAALLEQLPNAAQGYAVASDRDQARLLVAEMAGFARRTPELGGALTVETWRVAASRSGAAVTALAADGPSAYGLRPHLVIADELAQWGSTTGPREVWQAVVSAVPKVASGRLVVLTTAGDPAHWSARVRDHALASPRWRVHEVPGPCPWIDPAALDEQRALLAPSAFARLHLNRWTAAEDRLTTVDDLRACVTLDGPLAPARGTRHMVGLDLGLTNDRAVAAVCHLDPPRQPSPAEVLAGPDPPPKSAARVVLDRMQVWAGSRANPVQLQTVEEWLLEAHRAYHQPPLVFDPFQAVGMAQRLQRRGLRCEAFTFSSGSVGRLASTLYRLLRDHRLALPDDPELLDELANVRLRETSPGVYRMDHDPDKHDDRAIALALAANRLLEAPQRSRQVVSW